MKIKRLINTINHSLYLRIDILYPKAKTSLNLYDTKTISCTKCGKCIGEVDYDCEIIRPLCGKCAHPLPEGDTILYAISAIRSKTKDHGIVV